jgi:hypothetical protein
MQVGMEMFGIGKVKRQAKQSTGVLGGPCKTRTRRGRLLKKRCEIGLGLSVDGSQDQAKE